MIAQQRDARIAIAQQRDARIAIKSLIDQLVVIGLGIGLNYPGAIDAA